MSLTVCKYSVDTSALMHAQRIYPDELFPSVWRLLDRLACNKIMSAVDPVLWELIEKDDYVAQWAKDRPDLFVPLGARLQAQARTILENHPTLIDHKKKKSSADPFVIALAKSHSLIVVTEEKPTNQIARVKIPDVCRANGVQQITLLDMLRREGLRA